MTWSVSASNIERLNLSFLQSGAKINISDSSCPERIVTVTGTTDQIFKAFNMICKKFEDVSMLQSNFTPHIYM